MTFPSELTDAARQVLAAARAKGWTIATAESCTGGLIAACLTEIPGSSAVVDRGYVTYSDAAKTALLGVPEALLAARGAVSGEVAAAMADGALAAGGADLAVAVTGIAGPGGGTPQKPVGLVWFGVASRGRPATAVERRFGDLGRGAVRLAAVKTALTLLRGALEGGDQGGGVG